MELSSLDHVRFREIPLWYGIVFIMIPIDLLCDQLECNSFSFSFCFYPAYNYCTPNIPGRRQYQSEVSKSFDFAIINVKLLALDYSSVTCVYLGMDGTN